MTTPGRFFDMFGSFPTAERLAFDIRSWGMVDGYNDMFAARLSKFLDVPLDAISEVMHLDAAQFPKRAVDILEPHTRTASELVEYLTAQGATCTVLHNLLPTEPWLSNDSLAEITSQFPDRLIGFCRIDPRDGTAAAAEIRRCIPGLGMRGVTMTPFWARVRANDPSLDPVYQACVERNVPVWIHTSLYWDRTIPLTYEHPLYLDEVASRFPTLRIIAGHGGWPWTNEMVAVAWRQPNVYVDISAFRPKNVAATSSGWDTLWYHLARGLRTKVVFGSTWQLLGTSIASLLTEIDGLGLADEVANGLRYDNLARVLEITGSQ
jgi:predicted TIM-barrel fold metal-dependent hydrolase